MTSDSRRIRSRISALLTASALSLASGVVVVPAARAAPAPSCLVPSDAATAFEALLPSGAPTPQLCLEACKRWGRGCEAVVNANATCRLAELDTAVDLDVITECKALEGSAKKACLEAAQDSRKSNRDSVLSEREAGRAQCRVTAEECSSGCTEER